MADTDFMFPNSDLFPPVEGLRHDGKRWVDAERPDRPFVSVLPNPVGPGLDMFGGSGIRKPPRKQPTRQKTRRRGPARDD